MRSKCYSCKYRGTIPGDCHSECNHVVFDESGIKLAALMMANMSKGQVEITLKDGRSIRVEGDPYGFSQGWFNFPLNFDPVWLKECTGYEEIDNRETEK